MRHFNHKCTVAKNGNKMYYQKVGGKWKRISNKMGMKAQKGKRLYKMNGEDKKEQEAKTQAIETIKSMIGPLINQMEKEAKEDLEAKEDRQQKELIVSMLKPLIINMKKTAEEDLEKLENKRLQETAESTFNYLDL